MKHVLPLFALVALAPLSAAQNTWYVPDHFPTIQTAIDGTAHGDTVIVRDGIYFENIDFNGRQITVRSENGPYRTTIDGTGLDTTVYLRNGEGPSTVLDGFTVMGGKNWDGGGISIMPDPNGVASSPTIQNCVIENNIGDGGGGGMHIRGGSTTLVHNCLIQDNVTTFYHGAGIVIFDSQPTFSSCTIRNNAAGGTGGGFGVWDATSTLFVTDSILSGNTPNNIQRYGAAQISVEYSLAEGDGNFWWFGTGCIDADPLLVSGPLGEAYLSHTATGQAQTSPCVDAGNPLTPAFGTTRTDGALDQGAVDMGYHRVIEGPYVAIGNLVGGQTASLDVIQCTPGGQVLVGYSFAGNGPTATPFGPAALSSPYTALSFTADASGEVHQSVPIPPVVSGRPVWVHGADVQSATLTNPLALVIG